MSKVKDEVLQRKQSAEDYLSTKTGYWDTYEQLFHNQLPDAISTAGESRVFDPKLSTLTLEREYRVMNKLPMGKAKGISKNDIGGSLLLNLIIDKYINPNANAQFDLLTKFRMIDRYSNVYGNFFAFVDWDVKKNGYVGPDLWLLNIRDVLPQVGAVSLEDSDYVIIRTWKPLSYFENVAKLKREGFRNLPSLIEKLKQKSGSKQDTDAKSKRVDSQYPKGDPAKQKGYFEVLSQYEGDRWVDYCVDADEVFRDMDNPHDNGELPVVCKYSIPLIDDFMGMGDFERGAPMQNVINSVWNLYLNAVRMSIFPPVAINQDAVAVPSSIQYLSAAKWLFRTQNSPVQGMVSPIQLNPKGIDTFNNTYQIANGSLLNIFSTTDTTVTQETEVGYGKTPKALQMQQARENSRDTADRFFMEQFLRQVYKKFVNLLVKKQSSALTIRMFKEEIEEIGRNYKEVDELYDEESGKLTIGKKQFGSTLYDYEIESGSTYALDQKAQLDSINAYIGMYMQAQTPQGNILKETLKQEGYDFKFGELFKKGMTNSGIPDWDKILVQMTPQEKLDDTLQQQKQAFDQMAAQMAAEQAQATTMNQTPAQPMEQPMGQPMEQGMM